MPARSTLFLYHQARHLTATAGAMNGEVERDQGGSRDLFTAFFTPLQQASLASRHAKDCEVDYLDSEAGIALQWANSVSR